MVDLMIPLSSVLDSLNEPQREAVLHREGPMLVLAGPGSGKTRVITVRAAALLEDGLCSADEMTCVTFTNAAAASMRSRITEIAGGRASGVHVQTFHALALRILRRYVSAMDFTPNFVVYSDRDSLRLFRHLREIGGPATPWDADHLQQIEAWKHQMVSPEDAPEWHPAAPWYQLYQSQLRSYDAMDFGDLLHHACSLLDSHPEIRERVRREARFLMVDEYQDTNTIQYHFVRLLSDWGERNLCVVGDPDQAIYGFRGADIRNILSFQKHFPSARVVRLEQNYRSSPVIIEVANRLIQANRQRMEKSMWTQRTDRALIRVAGAKTDLREARRIAFLVERELEQVDQRRSICVISRTRRMAALCEAALVKRGIPAEFHGGSAFYDTEQVRAVTSWFRLVQNPHDGMAFETAISFPPRGIGPKTLRQIDGSRVEGESLIQAAVIAAREQPPGIGPKRSQAIWDLISVAQEIEAVDPSLPIEHYYRRVLTLSGLDRWLRDQGEDAWSQSSSRLEALLERLQELHQPDQSCLDTVRAFLDAIGLQERASTEQDRVQVMTAHNAKGLEFPVVFLVGMSEGHMPHSRSIREETVQAIEEERRLAFVAITRAEDRLYLGHHSSAQVGENWTEREPSRFLRELPRELLEPAERMPEVDHAWVNKMVHHDRFGRGLVLEATDRHGPLMFVVNFRDAGRRTVTEGSVMLST